MATQENKQTPLEQAKAAENYEARVKDHTVVEQEEEKKRIDEQRQTAADLTQQEKLEREKKENSALKRQKKAREAFLRKDLTPDEMADYKQIVIMANSSRTPDKQSMAMLGDYRTRLKNNGVRNPE